MYIRGTQSHLESLSLSFSNGTGSGLGKDFRIGCARPARKALTLLKIKKKEENERRRELRILVII